MDLAKAAELADSVLEIRGVNRWFLPGTRERLIEAAWRNSNRAAIVDQFDEILTHCEIADPGSDPCDEINPFALERRQIAEWHHMHPMGRSK